MKIMSEITKRAVIAIPLLEGMKMKIKGLKPKATELELKPKCFSLSPKCLNLKNHHQQQKQNKTQSSLI